MINRMGSIAFWLLPTIAASAFLIRAQTAPQPDLAMLPEGKIWQVFNRQAVVVKEAGKIIARLDERPGDGAVWLAGSSITTAAIEVEIRGKDQLQHSFVGIAFHAVDDKTYEAVYFRPFNFRSNDPGRRSHAVQYVSQPEHTWQRLRSEQPGKFEQAVKPVPDPNGWFRARIEVTSSRVRVYVDGAAEPSLDVPRLTDRSSGRIGLWVGNGSGGDFAGLRIDGK